MPASIAALGSGVSAAPNHQFRALVAPLEKMEVIAPSRQTLAQQGLGTASARRTLSMHRVRVDGQAFQTTSRFWSSFCAKFGVAPTIFNYFAHEEVFDRIRQRRRDGAVMRMMTDVSPDGAFALSITNPNKPYVDYYGLMNVLTEQGTIGASYGVGVVSSVHKLPAGGEMKIAGEAYHPRFRLSTPIDGYGEPMIAMEFLRLVCLNGLTVASPEFMTRIPLGKSNGGDVSDALVRMIQSYSNDEGFAAVADRLAMATRSWASVREARDLGTLLERVAPFWVSEQPNDPQVNKRNMELHARFGQTIGDLTKIYGITQLKDITDRKASVLPVPCMVSDLVNFATHTATHVLEKPGPRSTLQNWVSNAICREYDLEGSRDQVSDFKQYFSACKKN
jgi:hypothetical protein